MKKFIGLFVVLAMMLTMCPVFAATGSKGITELNALGIITGDENGNLRENELISRAEYLALIVRASGLEAEAKAESVGATAFTDAQTHWSRGYIIVAGKYGFANGVSATEFGVSAPVTFNQAVKMAVSMISLGAEAEAQGGYPAGYLAVAEKCGITAGLDTAERQITRAEAANIIYGAMQATSPTVGEVKTETIKLWDDGKMPLAKADVDYTPDIKAYIVEGSENPAIVFYPGGAYHHISVKESEQIPKMLNSLGVSVFLVDYRVTPYTADAILSDAFRAIRFVRANAAKYGVNAHKIGVMGCSAGGHLAASVSTLYASAEKYLGDDVDNVDARPDFTVLCYPVISFKDGVTHAGSREYFLGTATATDELIKKYSCEENVTADTPPAFIWHTSTDDSVPFENSLGYAAALATAGVSCEMHIYPFGSHGLAVAEGTARTETWPTQLDAWLHAMNFAR